MNIADLALHQIQLITSTKFFTEHTLGLLQLEALESCEHSMKAFC